MKFVSVLSHEKCFFFQSHIANFWSAEKWWIWVIIAVVAVLAMLVSSFLWYMRSKRTQGKYIFFIFSN